MVTGKSGWSGLDLQPGGQCKFALIGIEGEELTGLEVQGCRDMEHIQAAMSAGCPTSLSTSGGSVADARPAIRAIVNISDVASP